jgi:hypothetical protein
VIENGIPSEFTTLMRLTGVLTGQGANPDVGAIEDFVVQTGVHAEVGNPHSPLFGADADALMAELAPRTGADRLLDLALRAGPYDLTLDDLEAAPHGIDLGPLQPRIPEVLRTPSGRIELAPEPLVEQAPRLRAALADRGDGMVLIGRRQLRSNNSWMHNLPVLVSGPHRCTLLMHPDDAARLGLEDGEGASVRSAAGEIAVPVEVSDEMMPGVVSLPHGWGHGGDGVQLRVAREHAGTNANVLSDEAEIEPLTGNAIFNGIPVSIAPVREREAAAAR